MRAGLYVRISDDKEGRGLGVARQEADCRQSVIVPNGWTVTEVYVDNDRSAYSGKPRPAYLRMLTDARAGSLDAIVAWHTDRLHRSPRELEEFIDVVEDRNLTVQTARAGLIDLSTPAGRMLARMLGAQARYESEHKADRQRAKHRQIALAGGVAGGGTRAYGYAEDRVTVVPAEAAVIREVTGRVLNGESLMSVCADLNTRGIVTSAGKPWSISPLRRLLMSYRLSGQREHQGQVAATAVWPAIIQPGETDALRRLLGDTSRSNRRAARSYPLKGLLRCSGCGQVLVSRPRGDGQRSYVCASGSRDARFSGCGKRRVLAEPVELFVTEAMFARLDSPDLRAALHAVPTDSTAQRRADNALLRLDELAATYAEGKITMREWLAARQPLEGALGRARSELASEAGAGAAGLYAGRAGALREQWGGWDADRQRATLAAVIERVTVLPGRRGYNRFDPARFEIVWRH